MITALQIGELDVAVGLTEGWVAGLAKSPGPTGSAGYKMVGTYVESPLCWTLSTGAQRDDIAQETDPGEWPKGLKDKKMGVSRIGSGSYVMGFVLARTLGWLGSSKDPPFEVVPLQTFEKLRLAVNDASADFFMWEYFTSKKYYDNGEIRKIGEIYTPWPSWHIVARDEIVGDSRLEDFFTLVDQGIEYFRDHSEEAVQYISTELDYSAADAKEWLTTVQFADAVKGVRKSVIEQTLSVLKQAHVVDEGVTDQGMILIGRKD